MSLAFPSDIDVTDVGYILSKYFRDSFRKFCKHKTQIKVRNNSKWRISPKGKKESKRKSADRESNRDSHNNFPFLTWMAVRAATMAGLPNPWVMSEKCVKWRWIFGSKMICGRVLHSGDRSWLSKSISSLVICLQWKEREREKYKLKMRTCTCSERCNSFKKKRTTSSQFASVPTPNVSSAPLPISFLCFYSFVSTPVDALYINIYPRNT